jgi:hypothetical protein
LNVTVTKSLWIGLSVNFAVGTFAFVGIAQADAAQYMPPSRTLITKQVVKSHASVKAPQSTVRSSARTLTGPEVKLAHQRQQQYEQSLKVPTAQIARAKGTSRLGVSRSSGSVVLPRSNIVLQKKDEKSTSR